MGGLTSWLITPCDLPWCNTDEKMWLVPLLSLGFSKLGLWCCSLELACKYIYLLDDKGVRHLKQGVWWVNR